MADERAKEAGIGMNAGPKGGAGKWTPIPEPKRAEKTGKTKSRKPARLDYQPESVVTQDIKDFIHYFDNLGELERRDAPIETQREWAKDARKERRGGTDEGGEEPGKAYTLGEIETFIFSNDGTIYYKLLVHNGTEISARAEDIHSEREARAAKAKKSAGKNTHFTDEKIFDFILREIQNNRDENGEYKGRVEFRLEKLVEYEIRDTLEGARKAYNAARDFLTQIHIRGTTRVKRGSTWVAMPLIRGGKNSEANEDAGEPGAEELIEGPGRKAEKAKSEGGPLKMITSMVIDNGVCSVVYDTNIAWNLIELNVMPVPKFVYGLNERGAYSAGENVFYLLRVNAKNLFSAPPEPERTLTETAGGGITDEGAEPPRVQRISLFAFYRRLNSPSLFSDENMKNYKGDATIKKSIRDIIAEMGEAAAKDGEITFDYAFDEGYGQGSNVWDWLEHGFLVISISKGEYLQELKKMTRTRESIAAGNSKRIPRKTAEPGA